MKINNDEGGHNHINYIEFKSTDLKATRQF